MRRLPALFLLALAAAARAASLDYPIHPVPFTDVRLTGGFWWYRQTVNRQVTIPFAFQQCEDSGRLKNFDLAAETMRRRANGEPGFQNRPASIYPFDDSDAYKAIEAASYELSVHPDPALAARVDGWIARIAAAQEPDGYLYTFRTMHPDSPVHPWIGAQRWVNDPQSSHELYCAGHLYEAGVAHFQATGRRTLLDLCLRNAGLLWRDFGDGRRRIAPGHEIVELGLAKLYRVTGDERYLRLAQIFLDARGPGGPEYNQRHRLVVDQDEAVGHAVRANYLYCGMADVAALTGDARYTSAITRIWRDVVEKKLYLTGGVGARRKGESYGAAYELPNDAYNETCASVALMMWAQRMFLLTGGSQYLDVFERTAYNGFISGVSISGDRFFYPNPLAYDGHSKTNNGYAGRAPWFGCACCPPNLMRMVASLAGYCYAVKDDNLYVNLFAEGEAAFPVKGKMVRLGQKTDYPWDGRVAITFEQPEDAVMTVRVRIPGWAQGRPVPSTLYRYEDGATASWAVRINGEPQRVSLENGYAPFTRDWRAGDTITLDLGMPVHRVRANPAVAADVGLVAFERGPFVYCVEDAGQAVNPAALTVPADAAVRAERRPDLLGGVVAIDLPGATAIPYFAWDNRGLAPMSVWLRQD